MPETVLAAITEVLRADPTLMNMLPDDEHVYHRTAPQDSQPPFVIIQKQSGVPGYTFGDHHDNELWTVKAVDRSASAVIAHRIDKRLRAILQDAELDIDDYDTLYCRRSDDVDYGEVEEGAIIHHIGAMYRVLKEPA